MKKLLFFICFFGAFFFQGKAHETWLCVYPNKKVYFEDNNKSVYCIRIDSAFNDNKILYPFSDLHQIDLDCYSVTSGSWISKYIALDEEGNTIFVNGNNQQILIKNQGELNEIWDVFENENIKVMGKITSIALENVLGMEDAVKTITFSVYNRDNMPIDHILNQLSVKVSEHFGLIKTVNFYYFEHIVAGYLYHFGEFNLIGINEPQLGFKNFNLNEQYFDFQVGDELHIREVYSIFTVNYTEKKIVKRYLSRTDYNDSIVYYYEQKIHTRTNQFFPDRPFTTEFSTKKDTLKQKIIKGLLFDTEPNEPFSEVYKVMIKNNPTPTMYMETNALYYRDGCLRTIVCDGCSSLSTYYLGLGGPYYNDCDMSGFGVSYCYDLIYYKKGDTEVGTPFDFENSIPKLKNDSFFTVYPNPASDYIIVQSCNNEILNDTILEIYDMQGRKHLSKQLGNLGLVDISFLDAGCYIVFVKDASTGKTSVEKIIIN